ncbi:DUF559 domain-containing protein [Hyphomicrobium sp. CS1BSMeth3]|uniref:endonuclease domain-containing protein n=1 Tax=Hyphomicrobium sp. CS1BSMeth3 TaxID=1892844 RepID=UPI000930D207|nr:DUF559 domain-containing protein [Hyphomicrobium sp. CS1BSMeth3]
MRGARPWRTNRARVLRADDTSAEARLWNELRDRRLGGLKFVRQAPIADHYVDFLCREQKVIVEVDGGTHSTDAEIANDAARADQLRQLGYRLFRVSNADVYDDLDSALDALLAYVKEKG